jgi:hypothetical protein
MFVKFLLLGLMAVLLALPAAAEPIILSCKIKGSRASLFGELLVVVDLAERSVQIEAPEKMPGFRWRYSDGTVAPILAQGPAWMMKAITPSTVPVAQFVNVAPQWVTLGWRNSNGQLGQVSTFNRSALGKPGASCLWHSFFDFELASFVSERAHA